MKEISPGLTAASHFHYIALLINPKKLAHALDELEHFAVYVSLKAAFTEGGELMRCVVF